MFDPITSPCATGKVPLVPPPVPASSAASGHLASALEGPGNVSGGAYTVRTMSDLRVVVIDDQTVFREMLAEIVAARPGYRVVGQFSTAREGLEDTLGLHPDLVVLDVMLPDLNGVDVLRKLVSQRPHLNVLMMTAYEKPAVVHDALKAGAKGVVMKGTPLRELKEAIDRVARGGTFFCPASSELLRRTMESPQKEVELSPREREILQLVASGFSTKEIARKLKLSAKTVANHRLHIRNKLDLHDVASVTRYAMDRGLIEPKA